MSHRPAGLILHAAPELPTGEVQIVDVYKSIDAVMAFRDDRIFPAFTELAMLETVQASPQPPRLEIFDLVRSRWLGRLTVASSQANVLVGQLMWIPEIARLMTSRWISDVPSKMV